MSGELPAGWTSFSLTDIGGVSGGKTPSKANPEFWSSPDIPWVSPKDMKKDLLNDSADKISQTAMDKAGMVLYPTGSVLMVTRSGILQHTFPVALAGADVTVNQDIKVLRPNEGISPKLSFYILKSFGQEVLSACAKDGTTVQSIDSEKLEAFPLPLPPLAEQTRIVQKLDELLAQVDTLKARLDAIPALLKRFRQSVLTAAVSGRLTEEWRVARMQSGETYAPDSAQLHPCCYETDSDDATSAPVSWVLTRLDQCAHAQNGKAFPSADYRDAGVRLIRPGNLHVAGRIVWTDSNTVCLDEAYLPGNDRYLVRAGDIVMNLTAQSLKDDFLGRVCIYIDEIPALLNQRQCVFVFDGNSPLMKEYLFWYFRSPQFRAFVDTLDSGSLIKHMYTKQLSDHEIATPSAEEQTEIVRRVEQLFAFADQLEAKVASAKSRIDRLTQSILAKAFRGELVAQDPNDEPASVLLERIQAQRAAAPKAKRGRKSA
ncbi:restriction endonuclease subunit S [Pseudomonas sp. sp1636]|uniref:restriction endonuclease subunit S n=1 Tax=Pseudomonas sp. sp1636 TaxID=3036707 RepID=UPI0025A611D5|nr:restriction endonuclease subunit S [Pseudomonas sp. sp1636]MDM8348282.1 restriction endonuclease subunit S [Pseudomonas sp. sp1636]